MHPAERRSEKVFLGFEDGPFGMNISISIFGNIDISNTGNIVLFLRTGI